MYPDFAYSREMQVLLAAQTFLGNMLIMYLMSNLLMAVSKERATVGQRLNFAFWAGAVSYTGFIYAVYLLGGMMSFSPLQYMLVITPNPLTGFLFYLIGIRTLKLAPLRLIKLMGYFYIYFAFIVSVNRMTSTLYTIEVLPRFNYWQNAEQQMANLIVTCVICLATAQIIKRKKLIIRLADKVFIDPKRELILYFVRMGFVYLLTVLLPMVIHDSVLSAVIVVLMLAFVFALSAVFDAFAVSKAELENSKVHIAALSKGIHEFSSVKHDFYNILHTYDGYLELGDLDQLKKYHGSLKTLTTHAGSAIELSRRSEENPALIALLINKSEYAEQVSVKMMIALRCRLDGLHIDNLDICRCLSCLIDNAIEAAAASEDKKVFFTIETKRNGTKLIIVTNSTAGPLNTTASETAGVSSKKGHSGLGLANVRKTIEKYGNCTFHLTYFNYEVSAYIELKQK